MVYPPATARKPVDVAVPKHIKQDYEEAAIVLPWSTKASAALSRRCLQAVLVHQGANPKKKLWEQIDDTRSGLPSYIGPFIDPVRNLGNVGAHPETCHVTGEIVDVEEGEAEWLLELLEQLFDFYYAVPRINKERADAIKARLDVARGKTV
jgi:hypothetical protein